jgi:sterol 3beta-glucosyltransferase
LADGEIQIKCVDPEDQMSVDSYFFASFHDNEHAFSSIKRLIDERPSAELPRVSSNLSVRSSGEGTMHKRADSDASIATVGLKKLGSVLKPFMRSSDKVDDTEADKDKEEKRSDKGLSILRARAQKQPHDSLETVRVDEAQAVVDEEEDGGYPPRQTGRPPPGMQDEGRSWTPGWIAKPASRIFGSSPSKSSLSKTPPDDRSTSTGIASTPSTRSVRGKQEVVTEVVEPIAPQGEEEESEDEDLSIGHERGFKGPRLSFASTASATSEMTKTKSDYSLMEKSETGHREDEETVKKFRSVFSLNEKEELIDRELSTRPPQADDRLPGLSVSSVACVGAVLRFHKLLLLPLISATLQDQGEPPHASCGHLKDG